MNNSVTKNIIVKGDVSQIFKLWADFETFPMFMKNIKSVRKTGPRSSHWVMEGPILKDLEWDAETTRLEDNTRIAWKSIDGDLKTSGQVTFNSLPNEETEIHLMLEYIPPAGLAGEVAAKIFTDPERRITEDLRNFKKYAETLSYRRV